MPHFLKDGYDGADVSTARVKSPCLGFCGGSNYVLERLAKDVDGSVDAVRLINPSEVIMDGDAAASFGLQKVISFRRDRDDHVAGVEANGGVGVCVEVVHETVGLFHGFYGIFGLLGSYFVEGNDYAGVDLAV